MFKKRISAAVIAVTAAALMGAVPAYAAANGDVDNSGTVDIEDAVMILNQINGVNSLTSAQAKRADVDGNGKVDIEDVTAIINQINGSKPIGGDGSTTTPQPDSEPSGGGDPCEGEYIDPGDWWPDLPDDWEWGILS